MAKPIRGGGSAAAPLVSSPRASLTSLITIASLFHAHAAASSLAVPVADTAPSGVAAAAGRRLEPANWDIVYQNITADVGGDDDDELRLSFDVGRGRAHVARILARGCAGDVTAGVLAPTTPAQTPKDADHDALALGYSLNRALLVGSNLWNATASSLEFCHVLELVVPAPKDGSLPAFAITSDKREVTVAFDMLADFAVTQELVDERDFLGMSIPGCFNINGLVYQTPEERQGAIESIQRVFEEHLGEVLQVGQEIFNLTVTIEEIPSREQSREFGVSSNCAPPNMTMLSTTPVDFSCCFEIVLVEECEGDCEDFANTTTMFTNVTDHLTTTFDNGEFVESLAENDTMFTCADIPTDKDRFEEEPEIILDPEDELPGFTPPTRYGSGSISDTVSVADYVAACKCGGARSFACDDADAPLPPNSELHVCIRSRSTDVLLDSVDSMVLVQGSTVLSVIETGRIAIGAITTRDRVPGENGFAVSTRVPLDLFAFAAGRSITVSGGVTTKFAGDVRRGLRTAADVEGRALQAADAGGRFQLKIMLAEEEDLNSEGEPIKASTLGNSAAAASQGIIAMGVVFSVLHVLVHT